MQHWRREGAAQCIVQAFAPWLASAPFCRAVRSGMFVHGVAVSARRFRQWLLPGPQPSWRDVQAFRQAAEPAQVARPRGVARARKRRSVLKKWPNQHDADLVVDWLEASKFIKRMSETVDAAKSYAKLFARAGKQTSQEMLADLPKVSIRVLRQARVRADCCTLLYWQGRFSMLVQGGTMFHLYLYCDGSPQWRGRELYASTVDLVVGETLTRLMLPIVYLGRGELDKWWKTTGLMWQLCLLVGLAQLPACLLRVRGVLTDGGVERYIAGMRHSMLSAFYHGVGAKPPACASDESSLLFQRTLRILGWRHQMDLIIRKGLCALPWFPAWLAVLKSLVRFIRDANLNAELCKRLRANGAAGLAACIAGARLVNFASWRWRTLCVDCLAISEFIISLTTKLSAKWFKGMREKSVLSDVTFAMASETWLNEFRFILWYSNWLTEMMTWVGRCPHSYARRM